MDEKILTYRKKHKRCRYCKYYYYHSTGFYIGGYHECKLKDKVKPKHILSGCFCKWYEPKEE